MKARGGQTLLRALTDHETPLPPWHSLLGVGVNGMLTSGISAALLTTLGDVYLQDYKPVRPSGTSVRCDFFFNTAAGDFAGYSYSPDGDNRLEGKIEHF